MTFLPEKTILGQLDIIEVYQFYDKPVLFSCKNESGLIFIMLWIDSLNFGEVWLCTRISPLRLDNLLEGKLEIRDIFTHPEDRFLYKAKVPYKEGLSTTLEKLNPTELSDEYLPESGQLI